MNVTIRIDFRAEDQPLGRVYTVFFPAILASNDGGISTKDGVIKATTIEGLQIITTEDNRNAELRKFEISE